MLRQRTTRRGGLSNMSESVAIAGARRVSKHIDPERDGLAIMAEYLQTDQWAIDAILRSEILTRVVVDPCCGDGRMAETAKRAGYKTHAFDLHDWGYGRTGINFLTSKKVERVIEDATVFMNSPFSLACEFVDRAMALGARKIVAFQRTVWRESEGRRGWWEAHPYNRRYQCGNRAVCWYGTIPQEKRIGGANQPHSFYVWERGQPAGMLEGAIWKEQN